uniref:G protein gamma domain-containing protein n=1 Tax=Amphilophus citrinellus TaxID=61819 RepID=A0A3Q0T058_AMPCI
MSSKLHSSNNIAHARRTVQQLRIEASIERIKVQCNHFTSIHFSCCVLCISSSSSICSSFNY